MLNGLAKVFMSKAEVRTECGQEAPEPMEVPLFKLKPVQIKVFQTQALDQGSVGPGGARGPRAGLMRESLHRSVSSQQARTRAACAPRIYAQASFKLPSAPVI